MIITLECFYWTRNESWIECTCLVTAKLVYIKYGLINTDVLKIIKNRKCHMFKSLVNKFQMNGKRETGIEA